MGEIMEQPYAERLELEFSRRLRMKAQNVAPGDSGN